MAQVLTQQPGSPEASANSRNIPAAVFIEDVASFLGSSDVNVVMKSLSELYGKYKFMESRLVSQKRDLLNKIPDIRKALDAITMLQSKSEDASVVKTHFQLADNVFGKADIDPNQGVVYLWIGANIMVKYPYEEAATLLNSNLASAQATFVSLDQDLSFLKDQITIQEVNIARVHNYNVGLKASKSPKNTSTGAV